MHYSLILFTKYFQLSTFWAHGRIAFLGPLWLMVRWVKVLWPKVRYVTSEPEHLTPRVRLSRALLPSVMLIKWHWRCGCSATFIPTWCWFWKTQDGHVVWTINTTLLFVSPKDLDLHGGISVCYCSIPWPCLTDSVWPVYFAIIYHVFTNQPVYNENIDSASQGYQRWRKSSRCPSFNQICCVARCRVAYLSVTTRLE